MMKGTQEIELDAILLADGCVLTSKNIGHPLIQKFLIDGNPTTVNGRLGAFQIYRTNDRGETLSVFLLRHDIDLLKNPNCLDVENPGVKSDPITPIFARRKNGSTANTAAADKQKVAQPGSEFNGLETGLKKAFGKNGLF